MWRIRYSSWDNMDSLVNGSKWDLLSSSKYGLPKIAYQVTRTRVLTVLAD